MKKLLFATCCIALLGGSLEASAQKKSAARNGSDTDFGGEVLVG